MPFEKSFEETHNISQWDATENKSRVFRLKKPETVSMLVATTENTKARFT